MLSYVAPKLLPPSLAILAVVGVALGLVSVWPEPWEETRVPPAERAPVAMSFSAPVAGVSGLAQPLVVTPVLDGGVPRGLLLGAVHEGSLFARMGLQENDVLLGFHDLGVPGAPQLVAHLERRGKPMRVEYSVSARATSAPSLDLDSSLSAHTAAVEGP